MLNTPEALDNAQYNCAGRYRSSYAALDEEYRTFMFKWKILNRLWGRSKIEIETYRICQEVWKMGNKSQSILRGRNLRNSASRLGRPVTDFRFTVAWFIFCTKPLVEENWFKSLTVYWPFSTELFSPLSVCPWSFLASLYNQLFRVILEERGQTWKLNNMWGLFYKRGCIFCALI